MCFYSGPYESTQGRHDQGDHDREKNSEHHECEHLIWLRFAQGCGHRLSLAFDSSVLQVDVEGGNMNSVSGTQHGNLVSETRVVPLEFRNNTFKHKWRIRFRNSRLPGGEGRATEAAGPEFEGCMVTITVEKLKPVHSGTVGDDYIAIYRPPRLQGCVPNGHVEGVIELLDSQCADRGGLCQDRNSNLIKASSQRLQENQHANDFASTVHLQR